MDKYQNEMEVTLMEAKVALRELHIDELKAKISRLERAMEVALQQLDRVKYKKGLPWVEADITIDKIKQILEERKNDQTS